MNWIVNNIPNTGSFDWYVQTGNTSNTQYKIKIYGYESGVGMTQDESDADFTVIQNPDADWQDQKGHKIQITSPNGGETIEKGETVRITWDSEKLKGVTLMYKSSLGTAGHISNGIINADYFDWTVNVGNTVNTQFKIWAIGYGIDSGQVYDYSDDFFSVIDPIPPSVVTSYPEGELSSKVKNPYMVLTTDTPANCSYSTNAGTPYSAMTPFTFTGQGENQTRHAESLTDLPRHAEINVYVKCEGFNGAVMQDDHVVSFSVGKAKK